MALGKSKARGNTPQAKRFGKAASAANRVCHPESGGNFAAFKSCMRREMEARLSSGRKKGGGKPKRRGKRR